MSKPKMRIRLSTIALALWSFGLNIALQKGWLDAVPNWAVALMLAVPICVWVFAGLTHNRFRDYLRKTNPYVAMTVFIVVGMILGGAIGGIVYALSQRSVTKNAAVQTEGKVTPSLTSSGNKSDFTATVIRYGSTRESHELFCDVQYVNTGQTRRTVLSVALTTRAKDEEGQHPFMNNPLEDSTFGNEPPLYVEPNQPIVKTYRYKLQGEQVGLTKVPGQVFGVLFTIINSDGTMNFVTIEAMMVGELSGTQALVSIGKRDISLNAKDGSYIRMDNPFVSPSPIPSPAAANSEIALARRVTGLKMVISLTGINEEKDLTTSADGATIAIFNDGLNALKELHEILRFPTLGSAEVEDKYKSRAHITGGGKLGSDYVALEVPELRSKEHVVLKVVFSEKQKITSVESWASQYGYAKDNIQVQQSFLGKERRIEPEKH